MSTNLAKLREGNPSLPIHSVFDPEFAPYGRLLSLDDSSALTAAIEKTPLPDTGNLYVADDVSLHSVEGISAIAHLAFGNMPIQVGYCNGHGWMLNALEYHKCSEVNFSTTGCVLMMALPRQIVDGKLASSDVVLFYLPPRVCIEVYPRVLHFAPCRVCPKGFNCLVVLEQGVNSPLDKEDLRICQHDSEGRMLWMRGKWLIAHPESIPASKGAWVGITGDNLSLEL